MSLSLLLPSPVVTAPVVMVLVITALSISAVGLASNLACSAQADQCVQPLATDCQPLYQPTFEQIFTRTIAPRCAIGGGSCHSGVDAQAKLRMDDIDETYGFLVGAGRVLPGDASCSLLVRRLEGEGGFMPPGAQLSEAERCALESWVASGATRNP